MSLLSTGWDWLFSRLMVYFIKHRRASAFVQHPCQPKAGILWSVFQCVLVMYHSSHSALCRAWWSSTLPRHRRRCRSGQQAVNNATDPVFSLRGLKMPKHSVSRDFVTHKVGFPGNPVLHTLNAKGLPLPTQRMKIDPCCGSDVILSTGE